MPRIRPIKPDLLKSEKLYELERETGLPFRIAVVGLILAADRDGRFEWRPRRLQTDVLPYDDCDLGVIMEALTGREAGTLIKYEVDGRLYGAFTNWSDHQRVRSDERVSVLPPPPGPVTDQNDHETTTRRGRDEPATDPVRTRDGGVTNLYQGSGGLEEGEGTGGSEKGAGARMRARAGSDARPLRPPEPGRVILNPRDAPEIAWIAPTEKQLVMLTDKANQAGTTVQAVADELGIAIAGVNVGRILDRLEDILAARRPARAGPKSFAEAIEDQNDRALAAYKRRQGCSATQ